jgi:hypothetical protein
MKEYTFQGSAGAASSSLGNWDRSNSSASASINVLSGVINAWLDSNSCRPYPYKKGGVFRIRSGRGAGWRFDTSMIVNRLTRQLVPGFLPFFTFLGCQTFVSFLLFFRLFELVLLMKFRPPYCKRFFRDRCPFFAISFCLKKKKKESKTKD